MFTASFGLRRSPLAALTLLSALILTLLFPARFHGQTEIRDRSLEVGTIGTLPRTDKRWALVIGIDSYSKDISPLLGSVNDALALKDTLVRYAGFADDHIILMTSDADDPDLIPNRGNILDALDRLSREVPQDGLLLFSFSGHGVSIGDDAFLVPSDGKIYYDLDYMRERSIDVMRLRQAIMRTRVRQVVMLLDACRNHPSRDRGAGANPLTEAYKPGFSFDVRNKEVDAFATIFATSLGDRAYEFLDKQTGLQRGYFSYAVETGLKGAAANGKGEVTLGSLIKYLENTVKERVRIEKARVQIPYPMTEGFRNNELVLSISDPETAGETSNPALSAWGRLRGIARVLMSFDLVKQDTGTGLFAVQSKGKWGFVNKFGAPIIPSKYDCVGRFYDGMSPMKLGDKWGYIDQSGREIVAPTYDLAMEFSNGLGAVKINDKIGFVDKSGKLVIPVKYDEIRKPSEGKIGVKLDGKFGFIDGTGKTVIPFIYNDITSFSEGVAGVSTDHTYDFIDKTGRIILPTNYDDAGLFSEGLAAVGTFDFTGESTPEGNPYIKYEYGFINKGGKLVVEIGYDDFAKFSEGFAVVTKNGKQGYIDRSGAEAIALKYDVDDCGCDRNSFSEGLAQVILKGKFGFVDATGREIIPPKYDEVWCLAFRKEGFIGVKLNGRRGFVDTHGNEYFDF